MRHIIWVMNSAKVVAKLVGSNQVCFLLVYGQKIDLLNNYIEYICLDFTCLSKNGFPIILGAG